MFFDSLNFSHQLLKETFVKKAIQLLEATYCSSKMVADGGIANSFNVFNTTISPKVSQTQKNPKKNPKKPPTMVY